jgi:hypothetical protein
MTAAVGAIAADPLLLPDSGLYRCPIRESPPGNRKLAARRVGNTSARPVGNIIDSLTGSP